MFCTLQGALDFIPEGNKDPVTVFLKNGTYTEMVFLAGKHAITILGEDRKKTILAYADNNSFNNATGIYHRGVFLAQRVQDLALLNLTIRNTTPQGGSQAETIILNGTADARAVIAHVDLYSFQDTLQINGQAYITDAYIEGDVDFMWGTGPCFFENCHAKSLRSNAYYTQIRNTAANHGYVYHNCLFDGTPNVTGNFLSRIAPVRFPASEVVLIDCTLTPAVGPVAWKLDQVTATAPAPDLNAAAGTVHFWEYNSHTPDGKPVDTTARLPISRQLTLPADAETIQHYSDAAWVLGGWTPKVPEN